MTLLTKEGEISDFINSKKQEIYSLNDLRKIYSYYIQCITTAFENTYTRLNDKHLAKLSINMIDIIFWTLYYYTFNIKLTMFLCERSILLYTEYIYFSKNNNISENLFDNDDININDACTFVINKTIGPLELLNQRGKKSKKYVNRISIINIINSNCNFIKEIVNNIISKLNDNDQINDIFNNNVSYMKTIILPLIKNNKDILYYNDSLNKINVEDIHTFIHIIRIYYSIVILNPYININELLLNLDDDDKDLLTKKYDRGINDCLVYNKFIKLYSTI